MKKAHSAEDCELQTLLNLNGETYYIHQGQFFVKFAAWKVKPTKHIPHGIRYSITFHDKYKTRIIGYDNSHDCLPKLKKHNAKKEQWDHIHKQKKVYYYEFDCASELIDDFWKTVENFLEKGRC